MSARILLLQVLIIVSFGYASAQFPDDIGVIKVMKKPVDRPLPDTGRYKAPQSSYIEPGSIRNCCSSHVPSPAGEVFIGTQYLTYTYFQLGMQTIEHSGFPTRAGFSLDVNIDKSIFGTTLFTQQNIYTNRLDRVILSPGFSAGTYLAGNSLFYTASPFISFGFQQRYWKCIQLSYGYNFLLGSSRNASNDEKAGAGNMNTHYFSVRISRPFYL